MKLIVSILAIGTIVFLKIFYDSYFEAKSIYFSSYEITTFTLVICFYIFLLSIIYLFFKNNSALFIKKVEFIPLLLFHSIFSISLVVIGEYTLFVFLQFLLLFSFFKYKNIFHLIYFLFVLKAIILVFASGSYLLYILDLALIIYMSVKYDFYLNKDVLLYYVVLSVPIVLIYIYMKDFIYEIYIWIDIVDKPNYISTEIIYVLTLLHMLIITLIMINKRNNSNFKIV